MSIDCRNHQQQSKNQNKGTNRSRFDCNICLEPVSDDPVVTQCGHLYCWPCLFTWLEPGLTEDERRYLKLSDYTSQVVWMDLMRNTQRIEQRNVSRSCCPVCKAECPVRTVVPLYIRNDDDLDDCPPKGSHETEISEDDIDVDTDMLETDEIPTTGLRRRHVEADTEETVEEPCQPSPPQTFFPPRPPAPVSRASPTPTPRNPLYGSSAMTHYSYSQTPYAPPSGQGASTTSVQIEDATTEFLSRLLLMLGSFVLLCLLLF